MFLFWVLILLHISVGTDINKEVIELICIIFKMCNLFIIHYIGVNSSSYTTIFL